MTSELQDSPRDGAYTVIERAEKFEVRDNADQCVMVCSDRHSADHYMSLLNKSYAKGYRQALRDQRSRQG